MASFLCSCISRRCFGHPVAPFFLAADKSRTLSRSFPSFPRRVIFQTCLRRPFSHPDLRRLAHLLISMLQHPEDLHSQVPFDEVSLLPPSLFR